MGELPPPRAGRDVERLLARAKAEEEVPVGEWLPLVHMERDWRFAKPALNGRRQELELLR